jgi:hypothetical protein
MADDEQAALLSAIDDFFLRSGLVPQDRLDCYSFVEQLYPSRAIAPASCQGYCSLTLFVGDNTIIQFRPSIYRLDLRVTDAAREIYGSFAPHTSYVATIPTSGLLVYVMERMEGISFKDFRASSISLAHFTDHRARLCRDFAVFLSKPWHDNCNRNPPLGNIGRSITPRLQSLSSDLPIRFRATARNVLEQLRHVEALPWVLTHGDIVASNIMVDPSSGHLFGFVDWAEAEYLPFGICLYGLEEILGEMKPTGFEYHRDENYLREIFWAELIKYIPDLQREDVFKGVRLARDLGVFLWHGIAFDNGAIDRVVQEGKDVDEIYRLDAFLDIDKH